MEHLTREIERLQKMVNHNEEPHLIVRQCNEINKVLQDLLTKHGQNTKLGEILFGMFEDCTHFATMVNNSITKQEIIQRDMYVGFIGGLRQRKEELAEMILNELKEVKS